MRTQTKHKRNVKIGVIALAIQYAALYPAEVDHKEKTQNLSAEILWKQAEKSSPLLKKVKFTMEAKEARYDAQSIFDKNPVLSIGHNNSPLSSWPSLNQHPMSGLQISVSQQISFPWESEFRRSREKHQFYSGRAEYKDVADQVRYRIYALFSELVFWEKDIQIYRENKKTLNEIIRVARARVSVNKMNSSQLLKLEADLAVLDNKIWQGEAAREKIRSKIEELTGNQFKWEHYRIGENSLTYNLPAKKSFLPQEHPLYVKARELYLASRSNAAWKKGKLFPGVTVSGGYTFRNEIQGRDQGEDFISLKASMPLPLFYATKDRFEIKEAEKKAAAQKSVLEEVKLKLMAVWKEEHARASRKLLQYENFRKNVIPRQFATYKAQLGALSSGTVTLLDVLDAYRRYLDLSLEEAMNKRDLEMSLYKLHYLLSKIKKEKEQ